METPREILRQNNVEISLEDHRPLEEIVRALGLVAAQPEVQTPTERDMHVPVERAHRIERRESRPYFA